VYSEFLSVISSIFSCFQAEVMLLLTWQPIHFRHLVDSLLCRNLH